MTNLDIFQGYGEDLERLLRLKTFPLAVKLLERVGDIPEGAIRPTRDLSYHLSLCQAFAMSRRQATSLAMLKEDMWCIEPVLGLGFAKPPDYFLDGYIRFPETAKTLEAGHTWAQLFPRLPVGKYIGVASASLKSVNFKPDLVILYCDPSQLTELLRAVNCADGRDITCTMSGHAACVYSIAPAIQGGGYVVTTPCKGDYTRAMARDYEMIFTVPVDKLEDLVSSLRYLYEQGIGFPRMIPMVQEYELPESYAKIRQMLGYEE